VRIEYDRGADAVCEYLSLTVDLDHDIVDVAPAARFVQRLRELIKSGYGLIEKE
jgi:pyruvate/2-oxoglutarate dehydrogenase complex dihydrolipoamide acyltransferase (E2) component